MIWLKDGISETITHQLINSHLRGSVETEVGKSKKSRMYREECFRNGCSLHF